MYYTYNNLLRSEKKAYRIAEAFLKHNVKPEKEDKAVASKDSEGESLSSREIQELQAQELIQLKKSPQNKIGSPVDKEPAE